MLAYVGFKLSKVCVSCSMLAHVGSMLAYVGPMLAHVGPMLAYVGAMLVQVGPMLAQVGSKSHQKVQSKSNRGASRGQLGIHIPPPRTPPH